MNTLEELIEQLKSTGLSDDQARSSLSLIVEWLYEEYPVMAAVVDIWLKSNGFETKQEA